MSKAKSQRSKLTLGHWTFDIGLNGLSRFAISFYSKHSIPAKSQGGFTMQTVAVGDVVFGSGHPLVWIAGPCVIESHDLTLGIAERLKIMAEELGVPLIFK